MKEEAEEFTSITQNLRTDEGGRIAANGSRSLTYCAHREFVRRDVTRRELGIPMAQAVSPLIGVLRFWRRRWLRSERSNERISQSLCLCAASGCCLVNLDVEVCDAKVYHSAQS